MLRFKCLTTGHAIIMGRKTYELIGKVLPNRHSLVVSRSPHVASLAGLIEPKAVDASAASSLSWWTTFDRALERAYAHDPSPFVIGGGEIYKLALPLATTLEITYIARAEERGKRDRRIGMEKVTRFPIIRPDPWDWRCVRAEPAAESVRGEDGSETLSEVEGVEFLTFERRTRHGD
jgi:dihydrofolate reductase